MAAEPIRVIQANVMRCMASQHELVKHFLSTDNTIAIISEPYVGRGPGVHSIQGIDIYQSSSTERVKACVMVKQGCINALGITQLLTPNLSVIEISLSQRKLFIASAYIEPDNDKANTIDALNKLLHETYCSYIIIGGDFNGHSQLWGCDDADARGDEINSIASAYNLEVCNTGTTPTFEAVRHGIHCSSIVDVTLASDRIVDSIKKWRVDTDVCPSSDHNAITYDIVTQAHNTNTTKRASTYLFNNKIADWRNFDDALTTTMNDSGLLDVNIPDANNIHLDAIVERLTDVIKNACFASMKIRGRAKPYNPWWTDALERLKKCVIRLHHS